MRSSSFECSHRRSREWSSLGDTYGSLNERREQGSWGSLGRRYRLMGLRMNSRGSRENTCEWS